MHAFLIPGFQREIERARVLVKEGGVLEAQLFTFFFLGGKKKCPKPFY
jgi:hypothetical protein